MVLGNLILVVSFLIALSTSYVQAQQGTCDRQDLECRYTLCLNQMKTNLAAASCDDEASLLNAIKPSATCFSRSSEVQAYKSLDLDSSRLIIEKCIPGSTSSSQQPRQQIGGCEINEANNCVTDLGPYSNYNARTTSTRQLNTFCVNTQPSNRLTPCVAIREGCRGVANVLPTIFNPLNYAINAAEEINQRACPCNTNIKNSVDAFYATGSDCQRLQGPATLITSTVNTCVTQFYGSLKPFYFDVLSNRYLDDFLGVIPENCNIPFEFLVSAPSASRLVQAQCVVERRYEECLFSIQNILNTSICEEEESFKPAMDQFFNCFEGCSGPQVGDFYKKLDLSFTDLLFKKCVIGLDRGDSRPRQQTGGCLLDEATQCTTDLNPFTTYDARTATIPDFQNFCQSSEGAAQRIPPCSATVVGCGGLVSVLPGTFNPLNNALAVGNEINSRACPCNTRVKNSIDNFYATGSDCEALQGPAARVTSETNNCVSQFYGSLKPFRFDVMANLYLDNFLRVIPDMCNIPFDFSASKAPSPGPQFAIILSIIVLLQIAMK